MPGIAKWASAGGIEESRELGPRHVEPPATGEGCWAGELHARGPWPEGCPVGPPRREGTRVCMELVQLEGTNAHSLISSEWFWKAPVMCGGGDWNLN